MSELDIIEISLNKNIIFQEKKINFQKLKDQIENFNMREMYIVDEKYCFDISSFIIKNNCILIKFDFIRGIIFSENVYLLDIKKTDVQKTIISLKGFSKNYDKKKKFHLYIIDILFTYFCNYFYEIVQNITSEISNNNENIKNGNYNYTSFINLQSKLINLEYRIKELKNITEEIINNKEDIREILFIKNEKNDKEIIDYVEEMFDNYFLKFQDLENDINRLTREMDNTQKIVNMNLLKQRNFYAIFHTYISMITLSLSFGSFIGSMFGMNLNNYLEENDYAFYITLIGTLFFVILICYIQFKFFKEVDKKNFINN